jgi:chromosome segregation ATPase
VLEQTAKQRSSDWQNLAQNLEVSVARMLPCDPKIASSISDVSRASEERLTALSAYLTAAAKEAATETESAQRMLSAAEGLAAEVADERTDLENEQGGVAAELANLTESLKQRPSLDDSQKALQQIQALQKQRGDLTQAAASRREALVSALRSLVSDSAAREERLKGAHLAFDSERSRWNSYYAARLARAQTECSIVKGTAAASDSPSPAAAKPTPRRTQGKKK